MGQRKYFLTACNYARILKDGGKIKCIYGLIVYLLYTNDVPICAIQMRKSRLWNPSHTLYFYVTSTWYRYSRYYFPRSGRVYPPIFVAGYPARACIEMSSFRANKTEKRKGGIIWIQSFQGWVATPQGVVGGRPWGLPDPHELVPLAVWRTVVILAPNYHHLPFPVLLGEGSIK